MFGLGRKAKLQRAIDYVEIYEGALVVTYANTEYGLANVDEFFAVGFAD